MAPRQALVSVVLLLIAGAGLRSMGVAAAPPALTQGDILFADPTAIASGTSGDQFEFDGRGAIYRHSTISASYGILSEGQSFVDPTNLAIEPTGMVVVVDQNWGELQSDTSGPGGAVLRVDPSQPLDSNATVVSSGNFFRDPVGITVNPSTGLIYVCDRNSTDPGFVVSIDPTTGAQSMVSDGGSLVNPQDIVWNPQDNMLYVVDPLVDNLDSGQVVRIDPSTGVQTVLASDGNFVDPVGISVAADGNLWVSDEEAGTNQFGSIINVNRTTGAQTVLTSEGNFEHPHDLALLESGNLVVTDPVANLGNGIIVQVSTATGAQTVLSASGGSDDNYIEPLGVVVVPNLPPAIQGNKTVTVDEDSVNNPLNINVTPTDPEGETVTITVDTLPDPAKGSVRLASGAPVTTGPLAIAELSGLKFNTVPNANGAAGVFTYTASDGVVSSSQTITLTITPLNDAPTAAGQSVSTNENAPLAITLGASDIDMDPLQYYIVANPGHGMLSGTAPNLTYTPTTGYSGPDSFTFKVNDGMVDSNTATISITVIPLNRAPVASGDSYPTPRGTLLNVQAPGVLGNDMDADNDPLSAQLVTGPSGASSFTLNSNGSFQYTPRIGFTSTDSFTYKAYDGIAYSSTVTVTIVVSPDPPVSTLNGRADASGTIAVPGGNGTIALTARRSSAQVLGSMTYTDPDRNRSVTSTQLTALVITDHNARLFGKGKLPNGTVVDFVVDLFDVAEPGRLKDSFKIEISNGQTTGGIFSAGNAAVNR